MLCFIVTVTYKIAKNGTLGNLKVIGCRIITDGHFFLFSCLRDTSSTSGELPFQSHTDIMICGIRTIEFFHL